MVQQIVFIPGFTFGESFYNAQMKYMRSLGFSCDVYVPHLARDDETVDDFLQCYDQPLYVVAQSMGGRTAILVAAKAPSVIKKIALFQPGPAAPLSHQSMRVVHDFVEKVQLACKKGGLVELREALCQGTLAGGPNIEQATGLLEAAMAELSDEVVCHQAAAMLSNFDISSVLAEVKAQVLIANSCHDPYYTYEDGLYLKEQLPHASLCMLPEVGHGAMLQTPSMICSLLQLWFCNDLCSNN